MKSAFPELTTEDVLEGVKLLDDEGFVEETIPEKDTYFSSRYMSNINYFSRYYICDFGFINYNSNS